MGCLEWPARTQCASGVGLLFGKKDTKGGCERPFSRKSVDDERGRGFLLRRLVPWGKPPHFKKSRMMWRRKERQGRYMKERAEEKNEIAFRVRQKD